MSRRSLLPLIGALLAAFAASTPHPGLTQENGRLFYEMVVTLPGTRSQGWHGTLYGPDGAPIEAPDGVVIETSVGSFENVRCEMPWRPCGFIRAGTPPHPATTVEALMDSEAWRFLLYVSGEGSRSEGWHGVLFHGGDRALPSIEPVETPLGAFTYTGESDTLWGWSGWMPLDWERPD